MEKKRILIDTDPGVDDFFCLAIGLLYDEYFDLEGITTIGGNNITAVTTQNALNIVHLFHKKVPVVAGANAYLTHPFGAPVAKFHGANGLGDVVIPESPEKPLSISASDFIYQQATKKDASPLTLVTVGPLTNIAQAFLDHPDLGQYLEKIVIMGGSSDRGNVTPFAEANIYHDIDAADIVFKAGVAMDVVGLNLTRQCPVSVAHFDELTEGMKEDVQKVMHDLIAFRKGEPIHDGITIASLVDPDFIQFEDAYATINTKSPLKKGATVYKFNVPNPNCRVAMKCVPEKYCDIYHGFVDRVK